jgi:hypothetical protein
MRSASPKGKPPCPKCGAGWPTVQYFHEKGEITACCTHCAIQGRIQAVPIEEVPAHLEQERKRLEELEQANG